MEKQEKTVDQNDQGKLILEVKNLNKKFDVNGEEVHIVKNANLNMYFGELILVLGPSGSGKSTLINTILGLDPVTSGEIIFLDKPIHKGTEDELAEFRKNYIGIIYQQSIWIKSLNVIENVAFPLTLRGIPKEIAAEKAREQLTAIGMEKWANYSPVQLSSGQQQKVALARCLVSEPQVIIADEPTGNLDFKSGVELMTIMSEQVQKGRTVVMITHDLNNINYATRIVRIFDGQIVEEINVRGRNPEEVKQELVSKKIYEREEEANSNALEKIKRDLDVLSPEKKRIKKNRIKSFFKGVFSLKSYWEALKFVLGAVVQVGYITYMSLIIPLGIVVKLFEFLLRIIGLRRVIPKINILFAKLTGTLESKISGHHFTISYYDLLHISLRNILHKKTRSFVTIGGISIGIGFTVFLTALGYGLESLVISRIATLDQLKQFDVFAQPATFLNLDKTTIENVKRFPNVTGVFPVIGAAGRINYDNSGSEVVVYAVQRDYLSYSSAPLISGEFFESNDLDFSPENSPTQPETTAETGTAEQVDSGTPDPTDTEAGIVTTYIPNNAVKEMVVNQSFIQLLTVSETDVLNKEIEISFTATDEVLSEGITELRTYPAKYKIIGVVNSGDSPIVYIPLLDMRSIGIDNYSQLRVRTDSQPEMATIRSELELSGYETTSLLDTINEVQRLFTTIRTVIAAIGLVALLIAAFGMFNTLTVSLLERTKEIGLMKSIGMKSKEVKNLFLIEAIIIGIVGGLGGILVGLFGGIALSFFISFIAVSKGFEYIQLTVLPIDIGIVILIVTIITGILTGFYPSQRATKISPINALRYE